MNKSNMLKTHHLEVQCCKDPNGPVTHLIASKLVGGNLKYFLFKIVENNNVEQVSTSQTPVKLYDIVWPKTRKEKVYE